MAFVFKIKYEDSLRRFTVPKTSAGAPELTFAQLDAKIREYFDIPASVKLVITYLDKDNDTITMTEDQEVHDACVLQGLNPLRLDVAVEGQAPDLKSSLRKMRDMKSIFDAESLKEAIEPILKMGMSQKVVSEFMQALAKPCGASAGDRSETSARPTGKAPERAEPDSSATQTPSTTRSEGNRAGLDGVFHHNVQCDGCGISPIVGPRFKSLTKLDYDLCLSCFNDLSKGSEQEYVRYDQPVQRYHHSAGPGFGRVGRCPAFAQSRRPWGSGRPGDHGVYRLDTFFPRPFGFSRGNDSSYDHCAGTWGSKPDGRFVCDVTIPDGAEMSPGTRFVKIWRLRNSGKAAWTPNTKLVRVGGDEMGSVSAVTLQVPPAGLAPEAEMDVAVDLIAPPRLGRYVSYWRLMTPYGVKFGHRVWALIQVTPNVPAFTTQKASDVNNEKNEKDEENDNVENPEVVEVVEVDDGGVEVLSVTAEVAEEPIAADLSESGKSDAESEYLKAEVEGFSLVEMPKNEEAAKPEPEVKKEEAKPMDDKRKDEVAGLLESMGFVNKPLVLELLAKNDNDFQRTLDDLVAAAEWDPILEELEEMGFYDVEMNRRLMIKNKGSVKRVVKELVEMYREPSVKSLD